MKNLTWQNPEQLFVAQELINKVKSKCCGIKDEKNLISGAELTNTISSFSAMPEKMSVARHGEQISGSFDPSSSLIYSTYGSTSVPQGWLEVLRYTNLGRIVSENDEPARVKIIVPHSSGQSDAQMNVYPCLYELNFEKGR